MCVVLNVKAIGDRNYLNAFLILDIVYAYKIVYIKRYLLQKKQTYFSKITIEHFNKKEI